MRSFSHTKNSIAGFTLPELLVSIAIIIVITSTVLVRYDKFDGTLLLKNAAYDVALTLREAQVRSVSAMRGNAMEAKYPFGITFTPGDTDGKEYVMFRYQSEILDPLYDVGSNPSSLAVGIATSTIDRSMFIEDVCVTDGGGEDCSISRLDISFRRPEFSAIFYAEGYGGTMSSIQSARIVLGSPKGSDTFEVRVSQLGQITVKKQ